MKKKWTLFLLWAVLFSPQYPSMVSTWFNDTNNSHGLLVPIIALFFIWKSRGKLKCSPTYEDIRGLYILICSLVVYILSYAGAVTVASRCMIIFSLVGLILYNFGSHILRVLAFPLFFLFFMIPVPVSIIGLISLPLQNIATDVSALLIRMTSIPVYQEGNMLYFAQTQLEVAEACSGIHSIMALLMLGTIFVYLQPMVLKGKILLMLSTIPIAMVANIIRITGTGILAHFYGGQVARGFLHEFSGMAVFLLGMVLLIIIFGIIQKYQRNILK